MIPENPEDITIETIEITNQDLTLASNLSTSTDGKNTVVGSGVFDDLMEAVNVHLAAQHKSGRLMGSDYANVYLGSLQSTAEQAVAFLLGKYNATAQYNLIMAQIEKEKAAILGIYADIALKEAQINLVEAQIESEIQKRILYEAQIRNMDADTVIKQEQSAADIVLKDMQTQKTQAERDLLNEKQNTEKAQTSGIPVGDEAISGVSTVTGVLGKQMHLYGEQAKAFKWNANQKHLKTLLDAWSVNTNVVGIGDFNVSALTANGVDVNGNADTSSTIDDGMNEWIHKLNPENEDIPWVDPGTPDPPPA